MKKLNKIEAFELLTEKFDEGLDLHYTDKIDDQLTYEIEEETGGDYDGQEQFYVLKVQTSEGDMFVRASGRYSSWDSSNWDTLYVVEPYEKTVRDWRKIK